MSLSYIMARMQLLSGTTEDWTGEEGSKKNLILMPNELAVEWSTESDGYYSGFQGIKIGDGQNTFENLSYITSSHEPNIVQSDWAQDDATQMDYIRNKPDMNEYVTIQQFDEATKAKWVPIASLQDDTRNEMLSANARHMVDVIAQTKELYERGRSQRT